ncbi:MAG: hypothetical protein QM702_03500 [Rubrivivax sp.]
MQPELETFPVVDALCNSLDTMAFISPFPAKDPAAPETLQGELRRVRITFTGPFNGTLELVTPRSFGAVLASNLLACDPNDESTLAHVDDVLKELANVTCGALIRRGAGRRQHQLRTRHPADRSARGRGMAAPGDRAGCEPPRRRRTDHHRADALM